MKKNQIFFFESVFYRDYEIGKFVDSSIYLVPSDSFCFLYPFFRNNDPSNTLYTMDMSLVEDEIYSYYERIFGVQRFDYLKAIWLYPEGKYTAPKEVVIPDSNNNDILILFKKLSTYEKKVKVRLRFFIKGKALKSKRKVRTMPKLNSIKCKAQNKKFYHNYVLGLDSIVWFPSYLEIVK